MVVYEEARDDSEPELTRVLNCHKHEPCQEKARRMAKQQNWHGSWDELGTYLVQQAPNAGMTLSDLVDRHEYLSDRGMIPAPVEETF